MSELNYAPNNSPMSRLVSPFMQRMAGSEAWALFNEGEMARQEAAGQQTQAFNDRVLSANMEQARQKAQIERMTQLINLFGHQASQGVMDPNTYAMATGAPISGEAAAGGRAKLLETISKAAQNFSKSDVGVPAGPLNQAFNTDVFRPQAPLELRQEGMRQAGETGRQGNSDGKVTLAFEIDPITGKPVPKISGRFNANQVNPALLSNMQGLIAQTPTGPTPNASSVPGRVTNPNGGSASAPPVSPSDPTTIRQSQAALRLKSNNGYEVLSSVTGAPVATFVDAFKRQGIDVDPNTLHVVRGRDGKQQVAGLTKDNQVRVLNIRQSPQQ